MIELHIPDMSCGHCKQAVSNAVQTVDQSATLSFDMESRHANIESNANTEILIKVLADAGYKANVV